MARLGLKNYQNPQFAIPTIAPDQRPLNQLSKFAQWLHSVYDWRVNNDEDGESETAEESSTGNGNSTEEERTSYDTAPVGKSDPTESRAYREGESEDAVEPDRNESGISNETESAYDAGSDSYQNSMEEAFEKAQAARDAKLRSMINASAVGSRGEPTLEVQKFSGLEGKDLDSVGGPKTQRALWNKLYEDGGTGDDRLTRVEPFGWATEEFDPAIIGR